MGINYSANSIVVPIQPSVVELARLNIPTLGVLAKWQTSNETIKWDANFGGQTATGESVNASVNTFGQDAVDGASLPIATHRLRASFQIHEVKFTAAAEAARNGSPDELANLLDYSSQGARREILRSLGSQIFVGTGAAASGGVIGLEATVATQRDANSGAILNKTVSTVNYAGINPVTAGYEKWTSLIHANFGKISKGKLRDLDVDIRNGSTSGVPSSYDAIVMNPSTANLYLAEFDAAYSGQRQPLEGADMGYGRLSFNGRPVIEDPNCSPSVMHFIDSTQIRLYSFNQEEGALFSDETPVEGLLTYVKVLPSDNPQMVKLALFGMYQLQLRDRSALTTVKGITAV